MSLLGMCIVDSWLLYQGARNGTGCISQREFYELLAGELIENEFDSIRFCRRYSSEFKSDDDNMNLYPNTELDLI